MLYSNDADQKRNSSTKKESGPLQPLVDLVPSNFLELPLTTKHASSFFSILFGIAMISTETNKPVKSFLILK